MGSTPTQKKIKKLLPSRRLNIEKDYLYDDQYKCWELVTDMENLDRPKDSYCPYLKYSPVDFRIRRSNGPSDKYSKNDPLCLKLANNGSQHWGCGIGDLRLLDNGESGLVTTCRAGDKIDLTINKVSEIGAKK